MNTWKSVKELLKDTAQEMAQGAVFVQLTQKLEKQTKQGRPYLELGFADAAGDFVLKIWDNMPLYQQSSSLQINECFELSAHWQQSPYGVEAQNLTARPLDVQEQELLFAGDADLLARQAQDWSTITQAIAEMADPRLKGLCQALVDKFEARYRRAAAARGYHHARRGGLVEHVAGMMRAIQGLCLAYPHLNRDLLITGAFFHDVGKMWENHYPEQSFQMPYSELGELLGHIPLGLELINSLWQTLIKSEEAQTWAELEPSNSSVRLHLLHLIASHHGELAFGSPVVPKTPEAMVLHFVDNIDAKLEMLRAVYETPTELAPHIYQRRAPLMGNPVEPLAPFQIL